MNKFVTFIALLFLAGCAGLNPNIGERSTDVAWTSGDKVRAFEIAKPKAEAGEPWAQLRLGIFYENGWGDSRDDNIAEYWYKKVIAQKSKGDWAEGKLVGATGKQGYFNQNSDARIAEHNLAQIYLINNRNLLEAHRLIKNVIKETEGKDVFFCCEFAGGRYFSQKQFIELEEKIAKKLSEK